MKDYLVTTSEKKDGIWWHTNQVVKAESGKNAQEKVQKENPDALVTEGIPTDKLEA